MAAAVVEAADGDHEIAPLTPPATPPASRLREPRSIDSACAEKPPPGEPVTHSCSETTKTPPRGATGSSEGVWDAVRDAEAVTLGVCVAVGV